MLVSCIFMGFCSISLAHHLEISVAREELGNLLRAQSKSSFLEPMRAINRTPDQEKETNISTLQWRAESLMKILQKMFTSTSQESLYLTIQRHAEINENWKNAQDQLVSLEKDSKPIASMKLGGKNMIRLYWQRIKYPENVPKLLDAWNLLEKFRKMLVLLKEVRFLELGKMDLLKANLKLVSLLVAKDGQNVNPETLKHLPDNIIQLICQEDWITLGDSIFTDLKQHITEKRLFFDDSLDSKELERSYFQRWKCAFTTIDVLFRNEFARKSTVQSFFEGSEMINQVIFYSELSFFNGLNTSFKNESNAWTKSWYWNYLHDSFQALSKKQENVLNTQSLLEFNFKKLTKIEPWRLDSRWEDLFLTDNLHFDAQKYLKRWGKSHESQGSPGSLTLKQRNSQIIRTQEMINKDVEKIINLVVFPGSKFRQSTSDHQRLLLGFLCDLLDYVEENVSEGVIDQVLQNNPKFEELDNKLRIRKLEAKMADLNRNAYLFYFYIKSHYPSGSWATSINKSTFDSLLSQSVETLHQYQNESLRVRQKLATQPAYLQFCNELQVREAQYQNPVDFFQKKSNEFTEIKNS